MMRFTGIVVALWAIFGLLWIVLALLVEGQSVPRLRREAQLGKERMQ
jgi:hypothetical protein